jgi:hypothetical protein
VDDALASLQGIGSARAVHIDFVETLTPSIQMPSSIAVYLNETREFVTSGILRPREGITHLMFRGEFFADDATTRDVTSSLTVEVGTGGRGEGTVHFLPGTFGLKPGVFRGTITPRNDHDLAVLVEGTTVTTTIEQLPSRLEGFTPPSGSRGEIVKMVGRGFIPADAGASRSMYLLVEGTFRSAEGTVQVLEGDSALRIVPDLVPSHDEAEIILRSQVVENEGRRELVGLTANPGTFQGAMTPVFVDSVSTVMGESWTGSFTVEPTRQIVYVKFLSGFSESLDDFGLRNVELEVRQRIFQVLERDYQGINITFVDERPEEFAEFSIIEVGGRDPNGADLLGLDNTAGKDVGNIRLDDIIGGENADSGELGYFVYGGVFVHSFRLFSPTLEIENELSSATFDTVFSPFMGELGGTQVTATEWPGGPRTANVDEAIRVMGNLIGNTVCHEIGHSLGLAHFPEDLQGPTNFFHNDGDEPNVIMDSGVYRPFSERAEVDGGGPQSFNEANRRYLELILPVP